MSVKKTLSDAAFDSLETMMLAYADEAVRLAADRDEVLDFTGRSIAALDRCLAALAEPHGLSPDLPPDPSRDFEYDSRVWGAYLGEVVRRGHGGQWQMSQYPGGNADAPLLAVLSLEVHGSQLYPVMKVFRRLTLGPSENVSDFYRMVSQRLGAPSP